MVTAEDIFESYLQKGISIGAPSPHMDTHADYLYHGTDEHNLGSIAEDGLKAFRPWHGTDQSRWPDGGNQKRVYFTDKAHVAHHFVHGASSKGALLRVRKDAVPTKTEGGTGDFYTTSRVHSHHLEVMDKEGAWHPISKVVEKSLTVEKYSASDLWAKDALGLEKASSPGQPLPPQRPRPRAPRVPTPFDPISGAKQRADPFHFKPHKLGDLFLLHQQDMYDTAPIQKVPRASFDGGRRGSTKAPPISKSYQLLKNLVKELRINE